MAPRIQDSSSAFDGKGGNIMMGPKRTHEERHLLNPAFCSTLLWHAALGATEIENSPRFSLSYIEAFLILPLTLHQSTRNSLPTRINSSMPVWVSNNPLVIASFPGRAKDLVSYTKEALVFGASGDLFQIEGGDIQANSGMSSIIRSVLRRTSTEVQECSKKAHFLGKWFAYTGTPETIFTMLGIRP